MCWLQFSIKFSKRRKINVHKFPRTATSWWYYKMVPPHWNQRHMCYEWYQLINWCPPAFILCPCNLHEDWRWQHIVTCTCNIFRIIQYAAHQQVSIWPEDEETVHDNSFTCMHCQLYKDFLVNTYKRLIQQNTGLTWALNKVQESLQYMNYPVHLLGNVLSHATTKFSVQGDSKYSVVTFSFHQGKCFTKCTDGICSAQMLNRKKIPKKITIEHSDKICSHLNTIYQSFDYVKGFFPVYFGSQEDSLENEEEEDAPTVNLANEDMNIEDSNLQIESTTNIDEETVMWDFKALSKHTPNSNMLNVNLVCNTQNRNGLVISTNFDPNYGVYMNAELKPPHIGVVCDCGAGYENGWWLHLQWKHNTVHWKWASWFKTLQPEMWYMWMWDNLSWWSINKRKICLL